MVVVVVVVEAVTDDAVLLVVDVGAGCEELVRLAEVTGVSGSRVRVATDVVAPAPLELSSGTVT